MQTAHAQIAANQMTTRAVVSRRLNPTVERGWITNLGAELTSLQPQHFTGCKSAGPVVRYI